MTGPPEESHDHGEPEAQGPIVRDKRRIDPETGEVRAPSSPWLPPTGSPPSGQPDPTEADQGEPAVQAQLAERTSDLQRVQAEYANYRRRVDRDRDVARDSAVANVLSNLLPVLDDIGRARDHGELEGGFKSVGEALEQIVERLGLVRFGAAGDPFDPTVHEALTHATSSDVTEPTAREVFAPGYRIGDRVVRPARVAVVEPE